jgi:hypothetical protein
MEISCPACGKTSDVGASTSCPRCACDLGPLARVVAGALWHLQTGRAKLRSAEWEAAFDHAERSWSLVHSARAASVACLAAAALGETRVALLWHRRGAAPGT